MKSSTRLQRMYAMTGTITDCHEFSKARVIMLLRYFDADRDKLLI